MSKSSGALKCLHLRHPDPAAAAGALHAGGTVYFVGSSRCLVTCWRGGYGASPRARRPKSHQICVFWNTQSAWDVMVKVKEKGEGMFVKEIIITNEYINEDSTLSIH